MLNNKTLFYSLLILILYSAGYYFFGERIQVENGFGWDGTTYAAYAQNFWHELQYTHDLYHINRTLPSFVIYYALSILHLNAQSPVIIVKAFSILNSILFIASGYLWFKIAQFKKFNFSIYTIGFISLFINYLFLKHNYYDPVLTDTAAVFLGMLSLYCYVHKKYFFLALSIIPAYFTWPISIALICPLLFFTEPVDNTPTIHQSERLFNLGLMFIFMYVCIKLTYRMGNTQIVGNSIDISYHLLPYSILIASLFIYWVLLNSRICATLNQLFKMNYKTALYFLFSFSICLTLYKWLETQIIHFASVKIYFTLFDLFTISVLGAIARPGLFIIAHLAFWGPIVILIAFLLKEILQESLHESYGMMLFIVATAFLALNSQTRQLDFNFSFVVYVICLAMRKIPITKTALFYYLATALVVSKVYYYINQTPLVGDILKFPFQRFTMNSGTYMGWRGYIINTGLLIISAIMVYWGFFAKSKSIEDYESLSMQKRLIKTLNPSNQS